MNKIGRNEKCYCGSGKKYKNCCINKDSNNLITHEPMLPLSNYPFSHVNANITELEQDECFCITIHGVKHYLHANTTQHLCTIIIKELFKWEKTGMIIPGWDYTHDLLLKLLNIKK